MRTADRSLAVRPCVCKNATRTPRVGNDADGHGSFSSCGPLRTKITIMSHTELRSNQQPLISVVVPHYNSSEILLPTVDSILSAAVAEHVHVDLVVTDDGSSEPHLSALRELMDRDVNVVFGAKNAGRSAAVNFGVANAKAELLLILDCDCRPGSSRFFAGHLRAIANADVSLGGLLKMQNDFWGKYQDLAVERRLKQFTSGMPFSFTTQNILIRRTAFQSVNGYDCSYTRYGFEDRDLLLRLHESGARFAHSPDSAVRHCDDRISLTSVARKMRDASRYSAHMFRERHPEAYRSLGYANIDASLHPMLSPLGRAGGKIARWLAARADPYLDRIPFSAGVTIARAVSALAYLGGSVESSGEGGLEKGGSPRER